MFVYCTVTLRCTDTGNMLIVRYTYRNIPNTNGRAGQAMRGNEMAERNFSHSSHSTVDFEFADGML